MKIHFVQEIIFQQSVHGFVNKTLYQSNRESHKVTKKQTHLQQKDVNLKTGLRYLRYWLSSTVVQDDEFV